jgi:phage shock protein A
MSLVHRGANVLRGLLSSVVLWFERKNPEALLENERENLRRLIGQFNAGLVSHAAIAERLAGQIRSGEAKAAALARRIGALVSSGDREAAGREALEHKSVEAQLSEDRKQFAEAEESYRSLVKRRDRAVAETRSRIEGVRRQIGDLKVKRAIADLEGMAKALIGDIDGNGASLSRLEEMVGEEREKATARARVAQSEAGMLGTQMSEAAEAALAETALEEFLSGQGPKRLGAPVLLSAQAHTGRGKSEA